MIIAIDGPAASGKGTLARQLAQHFKIAYLDTGLLYRAVGRHMLRHDLEHDIQALVAFAATITPDLLDRGELSTPQIAQAASKVAASQTIRNALIALQREFANNGKGAILDGRDIGTVILPHADVKLFVTASPEARAQRRFDELKAKNLAQNFEEVLEDIRQRDARDMARDAAPLKKAEDAHLLDTTNLAIKPAFETACAMIERVTQSGKPH